LIAALYIDPRGPYASRPDVDAWPLERDARRYAGPWPVVAHPPCGPWSCLRHLYRGAEHDTAAPAIAAVRAWGGVLEQPAYSRMFRAHRLPLPGDPPDVFGGWSIAVAQCDFGHVARKRTWLYLVGVDLEVAAWRPPPRVPTHWASGSRNAPRGAVPPGIKVCSAEQRRRTPELFAEWLCLLALTALAPLDGQGPRAVRAQ
jgi:hypothetical protein